MKTARQRRVLSASFFAGVFGVLAFLFGAASGGNEVSSFVVPLLETLGGLHQTAWTTGDFPYASATNTISKLGIGTTGQILTVASGIPAWQSAGTGTAIYGDGSDGAVTYDGSTTILGMAPSSNVYTLTRDIYCTNVTVNASPVVVKLAGFKIWATGTVTVNGSITANGNAGSGVTAGAASAAGTIFGVGAAGGNGGSNGIGSGASNQTNAMGGAGGNGGSATNAGGSGATATAPVAANSTPRIPPQCFTLNSNTSSTAIISYTFGAGGGGGGATGASSVGGGGGGGGGCAFVCAKAITVGASGTISANGGNGANGNGLGTGAGGGGGGGGGLAITITNTLSNSGTISANGGTKGTKTGTGNDGVNGSNGTVISLLNNQ